VNAAVLSGTPITGIAARCAFNCRGNIAIPAASFGLLPTKWRKGRVPRKVADFKYLRHATGKESIVETIVKRGFLL
jgi:hypothetical protein